MPELRPVLDHLDADLDQALKRLFALLRTRSISTDPAFAEECRNAADWLARDLAEIGFEARVQETEGHPLVVAHDLSGPGPHLLFYGHYDVQPVDPLELWHRDPFDPAIETGPGGEKIISGRGASDDKGQLMTFVEAVRAFRAVQGALPCKVTIVLEGEEESSGDNLAKFLKTNRDELGADLALVCDTNMWDRDTPAICTQLRGVASDEVLLQAANRDLHSGFYGGAAANPLHVLTRALAGLHDARGRVTLPGFYDGVRELSADLQRQWEALGFDAEAFLADVGLSHPAGEADRSVLEKIWSRPTAEVNGLWGGYTGAGFKTVIPAEAHAKVSFRLVGDQDPERITESFRAYMRGAIPPDCRVTFTGHGASRATTMPTDASAFEKARQALTEEWGKEAAFIGGGGSIPIVGDFKATLGLDTLLIGFALDDDRIHSPNEKYELRSFAKGCRSWARVLAALSSA